METRDLTFYSKPYYELRYQKWIFKRKYKNISLYACQQKAQKNNIKNAQIYCIEESTLPSKYADYEVLIKTID